MNNIPQLKSGLLARLQEKEAELSLIDHFESQEGQQVQLLQAEVRVGNIDSSIASGFNEFVAAVANNAGKPHPVLSIARVARRPLAAQSCTCLQPAAARKLTKRLL